MTQAPTIAPLKKFIKPHHEDVFYFAIFTIAGRPYHIGAKGESLREALNSFHSHLTVPYNHHPLRHIADMFNVAQMPHQNVWPGQFGPVGFQQPAWGHVDPGRLQMAPNRPVSGARPVFSSAVGSAATDTYDIIDASALESTVAQTWKNIVSLLERTAAAELDQNQTIYDRLKGSVVMAEITIVLGDREEHTLTTPLMKIGDYYINPVTHTYLTDLELAKIDDSSELALWEFRVHSESEPFSCETPIWYNLIGTAFWVVSRLVLMEHYAKIDHDEPIWEQRSRALQMLEPVTDLSTQSIYDGWLLDKPVLGLMVHAFYDSGSNKVCVICTCKISAAYVMVDSIDVAMQIYTELLHRSINPLLQSIQPASNSCGCEGHCSCDRSVFFPTGLALGTPFAQPQGFIATHLLKSVHVDAKGVIYQ